MIRSLVERVRKIKERLAAAGAGRTYVVAEYTDAGEPRGHWVCSRSASLWIPFNGRDTFPPPGAQVVGAIRGVSLMTCSRPRAPMETDTDDWAEQHLALLNDVVADVRRRSDRWAALDAELQAIRGLRNGSEAVRRLNR